MRRNREVGIRREGRGLNGGKGKGKKKKASNKQQGFF